MSITRQTPKTIWLGGPGTEVNTESATEAITPGMLIELTTTGYRKHASSGVEGATFALNQSMLNRGIDDAYAAGDLVEALVGERGATVYAIIPSGQNLAKGARVQSAGTGKLIAFSSGIAVGKVLEAVNNSAGPGDARVKIEIV